MNRQFVRTLNFGNSCLSQSKIYYIFNDNNNKYYAIINDWIIFYLAFIYVSLPPFSPFVSTDREDQSILCTWVNRPFKTIWLVLFQHNRATVFKIIWRTPARHILLQGRLNHLDRINVSFPLGDMETVLQCISLLLLLPELNEMDNNAFTCNYMSWKGQ